MNPIIKALKKIVTLLDASEYQYMIIGGLAAGLYSTPRQTFDIDIKIILPDNKLSILLDEISEKGKILPENPKQFVKDTGVLPVEIDGVRIDFILAKLEFEFEAIKHSKRQKIAGIDAPVTIAEDLIIQKCVSLRERDWLDIQSIIAAQVEKLDTEYILKHAGDLAVFMSSPDIINKIRSYLDEFKI